MKFVAIFMMTLMTSSALAAEDSNKDLFQALVQVAESDCGMGKCYLEVTDITCRRANDPVLNSANCRMIDYDEEPISTEDFSKSNQIFEALVKSGLNPEGAAGSSYVSAKKISCVSSSRGDNYSCEATVQLPVLNE